MITSLLPPIESQSHIDSICIGSGRFLRSVLVPALIAAHLKPIIVQTRGRTFMDYLVASTDTHNEIVSNNIPHVWEYEVDTVEFNGEISTVRVPCYGAGSLGTPESKADIMTLLEHIASQIKVIGVGVTEAGLVSCQTGAMQDLYRVLACIRNCRSDGTFTISVVNTDNVPQNGKVLCKFMMQIAESENDQDMIQFLNEHVVFHDTMVDRITSQREGSMGMIPRAEPTPAKALVIEDLNQCLPIELTGEDIGKQYGVVVRTEKGKLDADIALKLRIANGTHTAVAHVMALNALLLTDELSKDTESAKILMAYLDSFFQEQILKGVECTSSFTGDAMEAKLVWEDWKKRLIHPYFGLSTYFITQNGAAKGGIRIGPTVKDLLQKGKPITLATAFSLAAILRFLTPSRPVATPKDGVYTGWLDEVKRNGFDEKYEHDDDCVMYADQLRYNLNQGWYEFRCSCEVDVPSIMFGKHPLSVLLASFGTTHQPVAYEDTVRAYLTAADGGDMFDVANHPCLKENFEMLVKSVAVLYARMVAGDGMLQLLKEIMNDFDHGLATNCNAMTDTVDQSNIHGISPLHFKSSCIPNNSKLLDAAVGVHPKTLRQVIFSEVASAEVIDLHTHLLPPSHGALCLWGIDEILTYHYLVAEFFMTASPALTPEAFYAKTKKEQANLIWDSLFIERSPISEACRGVITILTALGLETELYARDLNAIRTYFSKYRDDGVEGSEEYSSLVFKKAGVSYAVMTNVPFSPLESQHWRPKPKPYSSNFRSALRVDPLLKGDSKAIETALKVSGYSNTLEGAKQYLRDWCDIMKPEYMMASTPHDFVLPEDRGSIAKGSAMGVNEDAMKQPFAFVDVSQDGCDLNCDGGEEGMASVINENSDFLTHVLMRICEERDLPIALKIGAHRRVNPALMDAGDGLVAFADANMLARLCTKFPKVRFLATFLSKNNQQEACVLATKFRNLHIYGCWWFNNQPSIIEEITKMRVEMLGTAFTAQHSDSRVLDQLIYKWSHSRAVIAEVLVKEYLKLSQSGWSVTRSEMRRDIKRIFGDSYKEFMSKSFM